MPAPVFEEVPGADDAAMVEEAEDDWAGEGREEVEEDG